MLTSGPSKVSYNRAAVDHPALIEQAAAQIGSERLIIAIDAKLKTQTPTDEPHWEVCTRGGKHRTGLDAIEWAQSAENLGAGELMLTSMERDGTQSCYVHTLTRDI